MYSEEVVVCSNSSDGVVICSYIVNILFVWIIVVVEWSCCEVVVCKDIGNGEFDEVVVIISEDLDGVVRK